MRLPVFFRRVSSIATGTNRPAQWAKAVGRRASKSACSSQSLRACKRYSALQSCWSNPKPARMRVSVAVPTTVNEPSAWRRARRKLRSCRNTGRHRKRSARKRFSNTAGEPRLYLYQGSPTVRQLPLKMSKLQWHAPGACLVEQVQRQFPFLVEDHLGGNADALASFLVLRPAFGQVQTPGQGLAAGGGGQPGGGSPPPGSS